MYQLPDELKTVEHILTCSDKEMSHGYMNTYYQLLEQYKPKSILEFGIAAGFSMWLWKLLCPEARVIGVDRVPNRMVVPDDVEIILGDVSTMDLEALPDVDMVIEDSSHVEEHQQRILNAFARKAKVVVIEDVDNLAQALRLIKNFEGDPAHCRIVDCIGPNTTRDSTLVIYERPS